MKHGPDSKYWHIRLVNPKSLKTMRTVDRPPVKQVTGINRDGHWVDQNIMIKKGNAKKVGSKLIIKDAKVKTWLKKKGINVSAIISLKGGGEADFMVEGKNAKR